MLVKAKAKAGRKENADRQIHFALEERKKKLAALKLTTHCTACGEIGHWAGDSKCPKAKGAGKYKAIENKPHGYVAVMGNNFDCEADPVCNTCNSSDTDSGALEVAGDGKMITTVKVLTPTQWT